MASWYKELKNLHALMQCKEFFCLGDYKIIDE